MSVAISNKNMYVQFIDDLSASTLVQVTTAGSDNQLTKNIEGARQLGQMAAAVAKEKGIQQVTFDRGGRKFHGRIKAIADAAREAGLAF